MLLNPEVSEFHPATVEKSGNYARRSLDTLPGEIEDLIIINLDIRSVLSLGEVNHDFHARFNLRRLFRLDQYKVHQELYLLSKGRHYKKNYVCYSCLSIKPRRKFERHLTRSNYEECGPWGLYRNCLQCAAAGIIPGRIIRSQDGAEIGMICLRCREVRDDWCMGDCDCCRLCADKHEFHWWKSSNSPRPVFDLAVLFPGYLFGKVQYPDNCRHAQIEYDRLAWRIERGIAKKAPIE